MNANQNIAETILRALAIATPEGFRPAIESAVNGATTTTQVLDGFYAERDTASMRARIATLSMEMVMLEAFCAA